MKQIVKSKEQLENLVLSPSSINLFYRCPRRWYFNYVLEQEEPVTSALLRGKVVHESIEDLFMSTKYIDGKKFFKQQLPKKWEKYNLPLKTEEDKTLFEETALMLNNFWIKHELKLKMSSLDKKMTSKNHIWNSNRPKFREMSINSEKNKIRGFIDAVEEGYDGRTILVDYKTSSLYKHLLDEDYVRQLKLYALMWHDKFGKNPDYLILSYLKYGENFIFQFKKEMLREAQMAVEYVRSNTKSTLISDYPCAEDHYCKYSKHDVEDVPDHLKAYALGEKNEENKNA